MSSSFVYVTYIRTTPEELWDALRNPQVSRQYWCGANVQIGAVAGKLFRISAPDGRVADSGKVLVYDAPRRLVLDWQHELTPDFRAEGHTRCTFELEPEDDMVKLTVMHEKDEDNSPLIAAFASGWPIILSSLKSLLETGESLRSTREWPKGM